MLHSAYDKSYAASKDSAPPSKLILGDIRAEDSEDV